MRKFVRTRSAPPAPLAPLAPLAPPPAAAEPHPTGHHKTNGHANGGAGSRRDDHSTLSSRYWSGSAGSGGGGGGGGALWEDAEFPAAPRSLGARRHAGAGVQWRRPHELSARPVFYGAGEGEGEGEGGEEDWEVEVGALGSAALCGAAAALTLAPRLLARVAPPQTFAAGYTGAFRFRLWVFGSWREVAVDDRLPCRGARLLASRARPHHYLLPLLEKAYAKLYGSYAAMRVDAGDGAARALQELTGGVVQSFSLTRQPRALTLQVLHSAAPRSTLLVARPAPEKQTWRGVSAGAGACVCVTGLARVRGAGTTLLRARAAGARAAGPGEAWRALSAADRDLLAARATHPDEFWISFEEFAAAYAWLELVHVGPDDWVREPALHARRPWRAVLARRRWRRGYNAGGPPSATETTGTNPQFHVQIPGAAGAAGGGKCHVVVSVTQQYAPRAAGKLHAVGFALYERGRGRGRGRALDVAHWSRAREVATFCTLPAGEYLLVPHTRRAHREAAFLLRVLTDQHADIWEVNEDNLLLRSLDAEFLDERQPVPPEMRSVLVKLLGNDEIEEVDAEQLRRALRRVGAGGGAAGAELSRALVALRDARVVGRMPARDLPPLLQVLRRWRHAYTLEVGGCRSASSYRLRSLLRDAGVLVSNKVLEALVVRFAPRATLPAHAFLLALARLYLAHERFRSLDTKLKSNPLSLEEVNTFAQVLLHSKLCHQFLKEEHLQTQMILMTIYS